MRNHVTIIPSDRFMSVDGVPLWFDFAAPASLHALQWHNGSGHQEWTDEANTPLTEADYDLTVAPYVALYEAAYAHLLEEANAPPTLEAARKTALSDVAALFDRCQSEGFVTSSLGFRADATRRSIEDIGGLITLAQSGAITAPVTFRDYDNIYHSLSLEQLQTLQVEVTARGPQVYAQKWALEAAIAAAETVEAVQAMDVTAGWPGLEAA